MRLGGEKGNPLNESFHLTARVGDEYKLQFRHELKHLNWHFHKRTS
jgi:hypothetical protein